MFGTLAETLRKLTMRCNYALRSKSAMLEIVTREKSGRISESEVARLTRGYKDKFGLSVHKAHEDYTKAKRRLLSAR